MVLEMIIRSSLGSEDVYILGETKALFYESVLTFIEQVNDNQSQYYQPDEYIFQRLINCMKLSFVWFE